MRQGAGEEEITRKCNKFREWEGGVTAGGGKGGGGEVKCNKTKGRENGTYAWREIEIEQQVQRARKNHRQVMINFNIHSTYLPINLNQGRES